MKQNSTWRTFFTVCAVIIGAIGFIALMGAVANSGSSNPSSPIQPIQPSLGQQQPTQQAINNNSDTQPVAGPDINSPVVVKPAPTPTPVSAGPDWSSYQTVGFEEYRNDPQAYSGSQIVVEGAFTNNFFPSSGSGNGTNFMAIEDYSEGEVTGQPGGFPNIEVQINNNHDYALTVQALSNALRSLPLRIYGTGTQSMNIDMTNGTTLIIPAISATRIDQCMNQVVTNNNTMTCEEWAAIFPTNIEPTFIVNGQSTSSAPMSDPGYVPTAPAPGGTSAPASAPSSPNSFQLNVAGACENDGNGTIILTGYPYANGYSIPSDDITEWSDGAVGFTVPSDMMAGTYQVDIRGYTPGVGTCPDVSGGSITVQ